MKKTTLLLILAISFFACMKNEKPADNTGTANMARLQQFYDQVMNAHNLEMIDSFVTADFVDHQAMPGYPPGAEGLKATFKDFFAAFPDLKMKTNFMKAWGDTVMAHFTMTGTNSSSMAGMPPSGKQFNIDGMDLVILKDGKAIEHWGYQEETKMMTQLGWMPSSDSAAAGK